MQMTYDLIDYDFLVRTEQWDKIIEKAEKKPATTPLSVSCVNLALSQKGMLADRLFEFYQNGGEGFVPYLYPRYDFASIYCRNLLPPGYGE